MSRETGCTKPIPEHRYEDAGPGGGPLYVIEGGITYVCADCGKTITLTVHPFGLPKS